MLGALLFASVLTGCGTGVAVIGTSVTPLHSEDLAAPCRFDFLLEPFTQVAQGVLVFYDRGDTESLYKDQTLRQTAATLHFAILWAHQCSSRFSGDFQADASKGPARMLFAALSTLAQSTGHPELETTGVILYGFSAAGVLTATMANEHPERLLGAIQYAAGSSYVNLDEVPLSSSAVAIPRLILANAADTSAGTSRSYRYFQRGRALGAPWAYGVQNATGHCCALSTRDVILPWIQAVSGNGTPSPRRFASGSMNPITLSNFVCSPNETKDAQGESDCKFTSARLGPKSPASSQEDNGWLPDAASGSAWLAWVTNSGTN